MATENETKTSEQQVKDLQEQNAQLQEQLKRGAKQMEVLRETAGMANIADLPAEVQADYASRRAAGIEAGDALSLSVGQHKHEREALESLPEELQEQARALAKSAKITLGEAVAHAKHAQLVSQSGDGKNVQHTRHSRGFKIISKADKEQAEVEALAAKLRAAAKSVAEKKAAEEAAAAEEKISTETPTKQTKAKA